MKKNLVKTGLLLAVLFSLSSVVTAQIYVQIRPALPVIVRTAPPAPNYVWIEEEWEPYNGNYRYVGGHWEAPPSNGYYFRPGYWKHDKHRGNLWIKGKWGNGKHNGRGHGKGRRD
jgi:hypothetical protein